MTKLSFFCHVLVRLSSLYFDGIHPLRPETMPNFSNVHSFFSRNSDLSEPLLGAQEIELDSTEQVDAHPEPVIITGEKRARFLKWLRTPTQSHLYPKEVVTPAPGKYKPLPAEDRNSKEYNGEAPMQVRLNAAAAAMGAFSFK